MLEFLADDFRSSYITKQTIRFEINFYSQQEILPQMVIPSRIQKAIISVGLICLALRHDIYNAYESLLVAGKKDKREHFNSILPINL